MVGKIYKVKKKIDKSKSSSKSSSNSSSNSRSTSKSTSKKNLQNDPLTKKTKPARVYQTIKSNDDPLIEKQLNGNGRPTKFTPEVIGNFLNAIKLGATIEIACNYAGICKTIFYEWINQGEEDAKNGIPSRFTDFANAYKVTLGQGAVTWLNKIEQAATDGNWQAAAWKLERRYPNDFGRVRPDENKSEQQSPQVNVNINHILPSKPLSEMNGNELSDYRDSLRNIVDSGGNTSKEETKIPE